MVSILYMVEDLQNVFKTAKNSIYWKSKREKIYTFKNQKAKRYKNILAIWFKFEEQTYFSNCTDSDRPALYQFTLIVCLSGIWPYETIGVLNFVKNKTLGWVETSLNDQDSRERG